MASNAKEHVNNASVVSTYIYMDTPASKLAGDGEREGERAREREIAVKRG